MSIPAEFELTGAVNALLPWAERLLGPLLLAAARFAGLLWTAPVVGSPLVPHRVRLALAILLALVVAPMLPVTAESIGSSWSETAWHALGEAMLGAALGFGIRMVLFGVELAATLIDQQSGMAVAQVLHPEFGHGSTPTGQLLTILGTLAFLTALPFGGDLQLVRSLLDSFVAFPVGTLRGPAAPVRLVNDLVLQSFVLGLQVAAPVLVTMGLLQLTICFASRGRGGMAIQGVTLPLRVLLSLLILIAALSGIGQRIGRTVSDVAGSLTGLAASSAAQKQAEEP